MTHLLFLCLCFIAIIKIMLIRSSKIVAPRAPPTPANKTTIVLTEDDSVASVGVNSAADVGVTAAKLPLVGRFVRVLDSERSVGVLGSFLTSDSVVSRRGADVVVVKVEMDSSEGKSIEIFWSVDCGVAYLYMWFRLHLLYIQSYIRIVLHHHSIFRQIYMLLSKFHF